MLQKKYGPPVIREVQSPKSYAEALEMAAALDEPIVIQDHGVDVPDSIAGIAREKRRQEATMPHNRPIAIRERFLLFHEHLGDPVHHAKLMEKATRDGCKIRVVIASTVLRLPLYWSGREMFLWLQCQWLRNPNCLGRSLKNHNPSSNCCLVDCFEAQRTKGLDGDV
jgi:hypothetical protein